MSAIQPHVTRAAPAEPFVFVVPTLMLFSTLALAFAVAASGLDPAAGERNVQAPNANESAMVVLPLGA